MHQLLEKMVDKLHSSLTRHSIVKCSKWAEHYRIMGPPFPGKWTFDYHPWLRQVHDDKSEFIIIQKAAQMGFTEYAINRTFYGMDMYQLSCLYILPTLHPDANDFSTARFDPALEESEHIRNMFSNVRNVMHKRAGNASLYIRGSRSRSQLKSIPCGIIIFDEMDEMVQKNIPLAMERTSGQLTKLIIGLSTPSIDDYGVNNYFLKSTQNQFFFKCPACSKLIQLTFPESLIITDPIEDSHYICTECKAILNNDAKSDWLKDGHWVTQYSNREITGYHIPQLYSSAIAGRPQNIAKKYLLSLKDPAEEQEFYNSTLGLTRTPDSSRVSEAAVTESIKSYITVYSAKPNKLITLGVDVGSKLHFEIDEWTFDNQGTDINLSAMCRVLIAGSLDHFHQLDMLMKQYSVYSVVIDANPERRMSKEFVSRYPKHAKMCFYVRGLTGRDMTKKELSVSVDRTSWMDLALSRFKNKRIMLPSDISREYIEHIQVPVKRYEKNKEGNYIGTFVTGHKPDHLAHARTYNEIALALASNSIGSYNIKGIL